jgi:hypothetical protein
MDYFNDDFRDFLKALNNNQVDYIVVGGVAVILHGYVRTTGDMDIWVRKSRENYGKLMKAFYEFGLPKLDMNEKNFLNDVLNVWSFGRKPVQIEIMTSVKGLNFDEAFQSVNFFDEGEVRIPFLSLSHLIQSKKAAGRHKDLDDVDQLTRE